MIDVASRTVQLAAPSAPDVVVCFKLGSGNHAEPANTLFFCHVQYTWQQQYSMLVACTSAHCSRQSRTFTASIFVDRHWSACSLMTGQQQPLSLMKPGRLLGLQWTLSPQRNGWTDLAMSQERAQTLWCSVLKGRAHTECLPTQVEPQWRSTRPSRAAT